MISGHSRLRFAAAIAALITSLLSAMLLIGQPQVTGTARGTLPASLSDQEFWSLIEQVSEPDGFFRSNSGSTDNLLSNESMVSAVAAALAERTTPSSAYVGVGPEQNFTYIAAIRPRFAFITDIRRGNLHLHLMYKALFEMSETRAEFVGRLFSRTQPPGLTTRSTALELMRAYLAAGSVEESAFRANLKAIVDHLTKKRSLPLQAEDLAGIEYVYRSFYQFGPGIHYTSSSSGRQGAAGYAELMVSKDGTGRERTYLASEENFTRVKTLQASNLIVPIVGDFAGSKALNAVSRFLKDRNAIVTAFYVSNVEQYLQSNGVWQKFCANVAAMPLDGTSTFIRPDGGRTGWFGSMRSETANCPR